ncbi:hypothetical protein TSUD_217550 [Trifolium subterraneum]|uniref:Uncharacterized protein n=1 Tax=Trifolium subterraneum TaxID=3900 RepID=A0A2Z6NEU8_TRISU|nr:hypothetical protein TSUD_217550 [Trifolium subterraneum]
MMFLRKWSSRLSTTRELKLLIQAVKQLITKNQAQFEVFAPRRSSFAPRRRQKKTQRQNLGVDSRQGAEVLSGRQILSPYEDDDEFSIENGNVDEIVDPNLEGSIVKECFELYLDVVMKCLAESGVERPSTGDVLQNFFAAMKLQKNGGNVQNGKFSRNDNLKDYSDLTPGIEFSDIMMSVGR